jgi:hypothetical protein
MPTGTSESAADRILGGLIKGNQQTDFQLSRRQKRSRCAGPLQVVIRFSFTHLARRTA